VQKPAAYRCFEVEVSAAQLSSSWFPVYWLPWQYNRTYRITLKQSNSHLVSDRDDRVVDPHVFFTAALSGCMVHVDGDPWQPTVYHSNMRDLKHDPPPSPEFRTQWSMVQKAQAMNANVIAAQTTYPKGKSHYARQNVDAFLYSPHAADEARMDKLQKRVAEGLKADFVQPMTLGMVFGVKSKSIGIWNFYYQSLLKFIIQKDGKKYEAWCVRDCKRFWPGSDISKPIVTGV